MINEKAFEALKDIIAVDQDEEGGEENSAQTINEIILRQIRKIGDICSAELTEGFMQKRPIKTAGGMIFTEEYHEDKREAYCEAVSFIIDLVYATSDDEFRKKVDVVELKAPSQPEKLKEYKILFREINKMFERTEYFDTSIDVTHKAT